MDQKLLCEITIRNVSLNKTAIEEREKIEVTINKVSAEGSVYVTCSGSEAKWC